MNKMDINEFVGSETLTVDVVRNAKETKVVILDAGEVREYEQDNIKKKRVRFLVEFETKQYYWSPNKTTLNNIAKELGFETQTWVSSVIAVDIMRLGGRDAIVGVVETTPSNIFKNGYSMGEL